MKSSNSSDCLKDNINIKEESTPGCYVRARYILAAMGFLAKFNMYAMRTNLSLAVVAMVNATEDKQVSNITGSCPYQNSAMNDTVTRDGDLNWNTAEQGLALGAYFYGYILTNIPGGYLTNRFGARYVLGLTTLFSSLVTILSPVAAKASLELFVGARILLGTLQGIMSPAIHGAWGKWAPPMERSKLLAISSSGAVSGTFATLSLAGIIASQLGWESVFYITGGMGIPFSILWFVLVYSSPGENPWISHQEATYIVRSIGENPKDSEPRIPWFAIMTSMPVWAITSAQFANMWESNTAMTMFPTYLSTVLKFDLQSSGFLAALPYILHFIVLITGGYFTDVVRKKGIVSTTVIRKVDTGLGLIVPGILVVMVGYVGCDVVSAVVLFSLSVAFIGFCTPGCETNAVDLAPEYGGIIYGLSNTIGNISGFLAPQIIGIMLLDDGSIRQWQNVFWMTAAVCVAGTVFYSIFASGNEQSWAKRSNDKGLDEVSEKEEAETKMI